MLVHGMPPYGIGPLQVTGYIIVEYPAVKNNTIRLLARKYGAEDGIDPLAVYH